MIESRLDPMLDDAGGGAGKYPGLTVAQVAERYRFLVEEGQGRSAKAILRISREQILARGSLGTHGWIVAFFVVVALGFLVARFVVAPDQQSRVTLDAAVCAGVALLFVVGGATARRSTRRAAAQVKEIQRLTLVALDELVSQEGFVRPPLDREHVDAFQALRKVDAERWDRVRQGLGL